MSAAELSIARRLDGATRSDVARAVWEDRTLIKTFGARGTVHLLPTEDLPMWTGALSTLPVAAPSFPEPIRFTPDEAEQVIAAIGEAVAGADLTLNELHEAVVDLAGPQAGEPTMEAFQGVWPRWRQLTATAAHRGVLCFGRGRGRNVTYTSPRFWLPGFCPAEGADALRALVCRYLYAYGPATPQQFARWLGVAPRPAIELFDRLADDLERVVLEGQPGWVLSGDTDTAGRPHQGVCLLPYFDAFVIASQPRARLYPGAAAARALTPAGQAGNYPVLIVDEAVGGVWHQRRAGRRLVITVETFRDLTPAQRRLLDAEADRVAAAMEANAELRLGTVNVGAHA